MNDLWRVLCLGSFLIATPMALCAPTQAERDAQREARFRGLWNAADQIHTDGDFTRAEQAYRQVLREFPDSQRTALRIAITQVRGGNFPGARDSYNRAIAMDPDSVWAATGLFFKARDCREHGDVAEARREIARLRAMHPDSSYVARAAVLEAQIEGRGVAEAEAAFQRELEAAEVYDAGMVQGTQGQTEDAIATLTSVVDDFPGTGASLRALDALGHALIRSDRHEEALVPFLRLMEQTADAAPDSRAARVARTRVAAIHHSLENRDEALTHYLALLEDQGDSPEAANAMLQGAGVYFEILQRRLRNDEPVEPALWDELRGMMTAVPQMPHATAEDRVRADLMFLETLSWQGSWEQAVAAEERFLATHDEAEFRREVATAHFFLGEDLMRLGIYEGALDHLRWVIEEYEGESEIWPNLNHLPRAHNQVWRILRETGAPDNEIAAAARDLLKAFPDDTAYVPTVRIEAQFESWGEAIAQPGDESGRAQPNLGEGDNATREQEVTP